jgi:IS30 family transposase
MEVKVLHNQYCHLSYEERTAIFIYRKEGLGINEIARKLYRHKSTISRELVRNKWEQFGAEYNPSAAHRYYEERKKRKKKKTIFSDPDFVQYLESKIKIGWSPEVISNRIVVKGLPWSASHESIYKYIYEKARHLIKYLRWSSKKKKRGRKNNSRQYNTIQNRVFIEDRPESIGERKEYGHWETDLMESSREGKSQLNVLVERKIRYLSIQKIESKEAAVKTNSTIEQLSKFNPELRKTITYDNGSENRDHELINESLGLKSYFCHPYSSWEKGTVENTIGLIRYYLPKKTNLDNITEQEISDIQNLLNNRPRKVLGFRTPLEVLKSVALQT